MGILGICQIFMFEKVKTSEIYWFLSRLDSDEAFITLKNDIPNENVCSCIWEPTAGPFEKELMTSGCK